ncbi:cobalt-precorrin-4 C(11)-methyltransferase [Caldimicrobium thiodismutans]|uniref:Cobalt-precorrin-4 C(11)-methyltransferase n=1 Tax=Caldimicrobium thiodismutans TaxID=1653476 RepID=A0A0U5AVS9_9BACT|nr:cobalt-precorrin-4/precorrin-4 C(11)-methyltransferase [Caldimicrobium thiodismutans]BAU22479.1 cobalt-precorrin-4 C(11)-methyltransferase [Caldimicrobium thiodismutans]
MKKVYFIGIGPGDPELLTLKALRVIKEVDLIIYPGSLISEEMSSFLRKENVKAEFYNAFGKPLEEIIAKIKEYLEQNKVVARLVSGDPALYSSIMEHIEVLRDEGITYEIIPGISSGFMASARLGIEFTYPELSNSVVFTRLSGKTGGATEEEILTLAKTKSTLVFFLSSGLAEKLSTLLLKVYNPETQVAILYKLSRKDEKIILTTLSQLAGTMLKEGITRTALIVVGDVLKLMDKNFHKRSILYGKK